MDTNSKQQRYSAALPPAHSRPIPLTPLDTEARHAICTAEAARHLGRAAQTLRIWACRDNGPLRPLRIHGRLAWPVADLRKLLGAKA